MSVLGCVTAGSQPPRGLAQVFISLLCMKFKFQYANTVSFYLEHCDAVLSLACWWCAHFNKKERCNIVHNGLDISFLWLQIMLFTGPQCILHHSSYIPVCVSVRKIIYPKKNKKTQNIILAVSVLTVQDPKSETGREHHYPSVLQAFGSCSFSVCVFHLEVYQRCLFLVQCGGYYYYKFTIYDSILCQKDHGFPQFQFTSKQPGLFLNHRSRPVLNVFLHVL